MPNKPRGHQCVNAFNGTTSHLLLKRKNQFPPVAADPANPHVGEVFGAVVKDDDNDFYFAATVVPQVNAAPNTRKRLGLRLVSGKPLGGDDILEGLLSITLQIFTGVGTQPDPLPVSDVPVEYIDDPGP